MKFIGVDIGGTFTDVVFADTETNDIRVHKVPTTPDDPSLGMLDAVRELCEREELSPAEVGHLFHGTTIATNAVLTHDGARTGMITSEGYRDIVHIGRHQRPQHYSIRQEIPWQDRPFARRRYRLTVPERIIPPAGEVLTPLDEEAVRRAARRLRSEGVEAIAVCFLFSWIDPAHEERAAAIVREEHPDCFVTTSASVSPQFREFERFTTTTMNAFIGPRMRDYMNRIGARMDEAGVSAELHVMSSNGGVATVRTVSERPVVTLLSGPAAGVLGGRWSGELSGRRKLITFDMGGTSADIGIVDEGRFAEATARDTWIAGYPVLVSMIDIHTIGAGGGSIARVDQGGGFRVGPESAGAVPGPAAYGRGGAEPTVTDANVVLGRLDRDYFLGGAMALDEMAGRGRDRPARGRARPRRARGGGGGARDRQREHGERDQLAHGAEGGRPPGLLAGRVRRRGAAARGGGGGPDRDPGGHRSPFPRHHLGRGAPHYGASLRCGQDAVPGERRARPRPPQRRSRDGRDRDREPVPGRRGGPCRSRLRAVGRPPLRRPGLRVAGTVPGPARSGRPRPKTCSGDSTSSIGRSTGTSSRTAPSKS